MSHMQLSTLCPSLFIRVIKTTALVSGNANSGDETSPDLNDYEVLTENEGPKGIAVVSNWEAIKEAITLYRTVLLTDSNIDESRLFTACRFFIEIGCNSLHQGILQQVHLTLLDLLSYYYSLYQESYRFIELLAIILAIPPTIHLPIIRRSAGLPFMVNIRGTFLNL